MGGLLRSGRNRKRSDKADGEVQLGFQRESEILRTYPRVLMWISNLYEVTNEYLEERMSKCEI